MDKYAELKWAANRWMDVIWAERNLDAFDLIHSPDFVDRSPAERGADGASYKRSIQELFSAFPDFYATVKDLVVDAEENKVAIRWRAEGSHKGEFMGVAATGKKIIFNGIEIIRLKDAMLVERWGEWDGLQIAEQLKA